MRVRLRGRRRTQRRRDRLLRTVALQGQVNLVARLVAADRSYEVACTSDRVAVDRGDHVAGLEASLGRGGVVSDGGDTRTVGGVGELHAEIGGVGAGRRA